LGAQLLVILGHENCGAVTAAYHTFVARDLERREPHEIEHLLMRIEPALREVDTSQTVNQQIANAVEENVRQAALALLRIRDVQQAQEQGRVKIVGAIYSVRTGEVRLLNL
jgi:carbonic anhydrase